MATTIKPLMNCPTCGGKACVEKRVLSKKIGFGGPKVKINDAVLCCCNLCSEQITLASEIQRWRKIWMQRTGITKMEALRLKRLNRKRARMGRARRRSN